MYCSTLSCSCLFVGNFMYFAATSEWMVVGSRFTVGRCPPVIGSVNKLVQGYPVASSAPTAVLVCNVTSDQCVMGYASDAVCGSALAGTVYCVVVHSQCSLCTQQALEQVQELPYLATLLIQAPGRRERRSFQCLWQQGRLDSFLVGHCGCM